MRKIIFYILFFFATSTTIHAQQIGLNVLSFPGLGQGGFYGGGGFELNYQHDVRQGRVRGGLEYRIIDWGNQMSLNAAYNHPYFVKNQFRISGTTGFQLGVALFRPRSLFVWGIEYLPEVEWQSNKRFFAHVGLGIRYTNSPKYKKYAAINSVLELPIKVGFGFRLGKKEE